MRLGLNLTMRVYHVGKKWKDKADLLQKSEESFVDDDFPAIGTSLYFDPQENEGPKTIPGSFTLLLSLTPCNNFIESRICSS